MIAKASTGSRPARSAVEWPSGSIAALALLMNYQLDFAEE
jgi:hypothetical protein